MTSVGIFGSNSFLVKNIIKELSKKFEICLIGRKNYQIKTDYKKKSIEKIILKNNFDVIINAVGYTNIEKCENYFNKAYNVNVKTTKYICDSIIKKNKKIYFIHFSSDHLYNSKNLSKEKTVNITNNYSKTKFESEKYAKKINSIILRTNFFGKSLHKNKRSLSDWIVDNLKKNNKINMYKDIYFSPLHFSTLSKIISLIIKKRITGIYNLGSKNGFSKYRFGIEIAKKLKLNTKLIIPTNYYSSLNIKRPKDMRMDVTYFEKIFNYKLPNLIQEIKKIK